MGMLEVTILLLLLGVECVVGKKRELVEFQAAMH